MLTKCIRCNGTGYHDNIPCSTCNTRGVVSDQLYDDKLTKIKGK
jgi:DnaJ-class molecular chaperone